MAQFLWGFIKETRPRQWIKNLSIFAALVFSGSLFIPEQASKAGFAFLLFCGFSSATYLLNDVFDLERDKLHPFKKNRPLAKGLIPPNVAVAAALILILSLLPLAYQLSIGFFLSAVLYLILQLFYSAFLKHVILIDVLVVAAGFVLRVYAGVWAIDAHLSVWFLLSVSSIALFLAIGKRKSEATLMQAQAAAHRQTLLHYPPSLLDSLTSMFANSTWLTYALFSFEQPPIITPPALISFFADINIPVFEAKYLMITVPVVIYAVMRYLYIIYEKKEGESPERILITDAPLLSSIIIWFLLVLFVIYYL